jgi:hypothetical protein
MEGIRHDGLPRNTPAVALRSMRLSMRCCLRDQRVSCSTKPSSMLAGNSSGCWPQTSVRGWRKLSGAATHAASCSALSNGTPIRFPRDGSMVLSPHTALCAPCTVGGQRWNHPLVCTDSSPTTKSVGLRNDDAGKTPMYALPKRSYDQPNPPGDHDHGPCCRDCDESHALTPSQSCWRALNRFR